MGYYYLSIKDNLTQIFAIAEKNVKLRLRVKSTFIFSFIFPFLSIIMPLIIFGQLFTFSKAFGPWDATNFFIFQIVAYHLRIISSVSDIYPVQLRQEKFWQTLSALLIAPFKRINLLLGIYFSHLISILIPFTIFFVIGYIYYPVSFLTVFSLFIIYLLFSLIFTGLGLIYGIGSISKENILTPIRFIIGIIFMFSCITLPFDFFPGFFQDIVVFNPLYYIIDIARLIWIENNLILSITTHPIHFLIIFITTPLSVIIGLQLFNYIFDKYGIQGY